MGGDGHTHHWAIPNLVAAMKWWVNPLVVLAASIVLGFAFLCIWGYNVASHGERLRTAHTKLAVGMTIQQVTKVMGSDARLRFDGPRISHVLTTDEADRCVYTLAFTNPYYLDPAIYCYFDADDILIAAHRFE